MTDDEITAALREAGLDSVPARAGGLDSEHDWPTMLSVAEQQLLALTRLTLARPAFAMLDRVTDALKPAQVRQALRAFTRKLHNLHHLRRGSGIAGAVRCTVGDRRRRCVGLETDRPGYKKRSGLILRHVGLPPS